MANGIYNYGQRRTSIDNPYVDEKSWYNYDNAPPTNIQYPGGNPVYPQGSPFQPGNPQLGFPTYPYGPNEPSFEGEGYDKRGIGNIIKDKFSGLTTPIMGGLQWLGDKFQRPEAKQKAYEAIMGDRKGLGLWDTQTGTYGGNEYDLTRTPSGLKVGSDIIGFGEGYAKNFDSMFGSESLEEMEQKKLDWATERLRSGKGLSKRLRDILAARGITKDRDRTGIDLTTFTDKINVPAATTTGGGARHDYGRDRGGGYTLGGGFTGTRGQVGRAGSSAGVGRGHHSWRAEGGRIGYQDGELVEDEYMAEATPGGMMEENIEEVQGEPSREQLEAIALEIFRLPLEQLNEQQLEVVYQAAMEQEPSEEEVQFAAQEGPGQGIASLV